MIRSDYINGSNNRITLAGVIQVSSVLCRVATHAPIGGGALANSVALHWETLAQD